MAAAMVSGGAALLLEGGVLTARQVKLALQLSSTFMPEAGIARSGVGSRQLVFGAPRQRRGHDAHRVLPGVTIAGRRHRAHRPAAPNAPLDAATAPVGTRLIGALELLAELVRPHRAAEAREAARQRR